MAVATMSAWRTRCASGLTAAGLARTDMSGAWHRTWLYGTCSCASRSTVRPMRIRRAWVELGVGVLASAGAVAVVSAAVALLRPYVPVLSLGALYVFAVLPVAVLWGAELAAAVSVASMLVFNWFFLPPEHTFHLRETANWLALAVYLVTALVVSTLAARVRRRRDDAEQRRREAEVLAEVAADLLRGTALDDVVERLAALAAAVVRVGDARLELGDATPGAGERGLPLAAGRRVVATLVVDERDEVDDAVVERFLPALAALLAVALDRTALAGGGFRGGGAAAERCPQDRAPAQRLARPALAADRDPRLRGRPREPRVGARRRRPRGPRRDDPRRGAAPRPRRRQPARPLAARGRRRRPASRAVVGGRARRPGDRERARGGGAGRRRARSRGAAGARGRGAGRAGDREPRRERAPLFAGRLARARAGGAGRPELRIHVARPRAGALRCRARRRIRALPARCRAPRAAARGSAWRSPAASWRRTAATSGRRRTRRAGTSCSRSRR